MYCQAIYNIGIIKENWFLLFRNKSIFDFPTLVWLHYILICSVTGFLFVFEDFRGVIGCWEKIELWMQSAKACELRKLVSMKPNINIYFWLKSPLCSLGRYYMVLSWFFMNLIFKFIYFYLRDGDTSVFCFFFEKKTEKTEFL